MKKLTLSFQSALTVLFLLFGSVQAWATHAMWSELTYSCASPGTYVVQLKIYRDCGATSLPATTTVNLKAPGCNNGRSVTVQKLANTRIGDMYCSFIPKGCATTGRFNFEETTYSGTVTFSATEQTCPDWVISWSECCRQNSTNLVNPSSEAIYVEARLKLLPNLINNSPQFGPVVSNQVTFNKPIQLSYYATDPDGDSLVYSVQNPLKDYNAVVNYNTYPTSVIYNDDLSKYAPLAGGTFTNAYPLITYTIDWSQPMPLFPAKVFPFNSKNGSFAFIPGKFVPNVSPYTGENKYCLVVQVDEYRKLNGVPVKIGTIRRDMFLEVIDGSGNRNPQVINAKANGNPISETDVINLRPGIPLNFQFATTDSNSFDVIALSTDAPDILPGSVFTKTISNKPNGTLTWTPTAAHIRDQIYYFHVLVMDDACPVKGHQIHTFGVKVTANGSVTGLQENQTAKTTFTAFPNPFSEELYFNLNLQTKAESIAIFNLLGQKLAEIPLKTVGVGAQKVQWPNAGKQAAGTYIARLVSADKTVQTLKFTKLQ